MRMEVSLVRPQVRQYSVLYVQHGQPHVVTMKEKRIRFFEAIRDLSDDEIALVISYMPYHSKQFHEWASEEDSVRRRYNLRQLCATPPS